MSKRTATASIAVRKAWEREQRLVEKGQGTRDWNKKQQEDILKYGKAYDEDGKAFEGHHMKSVEKYPEYQHDPDNIQFLSREEHCLAHKGNFKNPTNGYFNYITRKTIEFEDNKLVPCKVIELSDPIKLKTCVVEKDIGEDEEFSEKLELLVKAMKKKKTATDISKTSNGNPAMNQDKGEQFRNTENNKLHKVISILGKVMGYATPIVGGAAAGIAAYSAISGDSNNGQDVDSLNPDDNLNEYTDINTDISESQPRSSPSEHIVSPSKQRYHYKENGEDVVKWVEKKEYPRPRDGKKK